MTSRNSNDVISRTYANDIKEAIIKFSFVKRLSIEEFNKLFKVVKA